MERLVQAMMALTLVAPALAAPGGAMLANLYQQGQQHKLMDGLTGPMNTMHTSMIKMPPPAPTLSAAPPAEQQPDMASSSSLELRRADKNKPSDNPCSPGDRQCHASLDSVLFCNDNRQWVQYSECQSGTFCHRLHIICVVEVVDAAASASSSPPRGQQEHNMPRDGGNGGHVDCKEGDRRCSLTFNRVDRCNGNNEWTTYHDCRKAELCNEDVQECLPKVTVQPVEPTPTDTPAASAAMSSDTMTSTTTMSST